ncbi:hypothetical protein PIB30_060789 [Stylosanthes scabra]|uniref:Uncharacterized protein n=1 Tax=Stylosanthes scabra TaxID=79078 RepID=A0ABU6VJW9_9FABA|nr:hypothetical protein [Stylosanthes scabra]
MAKKKSCQNVRVPRVLSVVERELYGWVDEEIFTHPSVVEAEMLFELRREMRLTVNQAAEGDFVLEAAGPSDRLPFRAQEDMTHYLWVYTEFFTRLGVRLPLQTSRGRFCQLHAPPPGKGFMSFRAYQGRKLFDSFEESIQEFKWHYFKVLPFPGKRPFCLFLPGWGKNPTLSVVGFWITMMLMLGRFLIACSRIWINRVVLTPYAEDEGGGRGGSSLNPSVIQGSDGCFRRLGIRPGCVSFYSSFYKWSHPGDFWPFGPGAASWDRSVGMENTFTAKVQLEKELAATKDQVDVLTAERDSALAAPLLHAKIKSMTEELEHAESERLSAFDQMKEMEEKAKVQVAELESCRSALAQERKKVESLTQSLKGKQTTLDEAEATAVHWRGEWKSLAEETGEMVQETFEILMN